MIIDLESELSDGTYVTTSNAEDAGTLSSPPTVQQLCLPYATHVKLILDKHVSRLAAAVEYNPKVERRLVTSYAGMLEMGEMLKTQKNAHRAAINWISKSEMIANSGGDTKWAETVFAEVQALLREQSSSEHD